MEWRGWSTCGYPVGQAVGFVKLQDPLDGSTTVFASWFFVIPTSTCADRYPCSTSTIIYKTNGRIPPLVICAKEQHHSKFLGTRPIVPCSAGTASGFDAFAHIPKRGFHAVAHSTSGSIHGTYWVSCRTTPFAKSDPWSSVSISVYAPPLFRRPVSDRLSFWPETSCSSPTACQSLDVSTWNRR